MLFIDQMTMDAKPRKTKDGYLVAMPKVARTGIQIYKGFEVGKPQLDEVRVFRPEEEVFSKDALHSYAYRPVTSDHPSELVDSDNWKQYSKGQTGGDVARDGEFINVPMVVMDQDAINDVENGKVELSMGYTCDLDFTSGTAPNGETYDAIQRNIRANHLAIVDRARGGSQLRVIDTNQPAKPNQRELFTMNKNIVIDGITVEVSDTAAQVVTRRIEALDAINQTHEKTIGELKKQLDSIKAEQTSAVEAKDAEIATLKKQLEDAKLTPEKLDDAVKARSQVIETAKRVLPNVTVDGKSDADIRKEVVLAKMGDTAKDWSDEMIQASFNTLTADDVTSTQTGDTYAQHMRQSVNNNQPAGGYDGYCTRMGDAWKSKPAKH